MDGKKTLCTFCGVVDQVTVAPDGRVRGSGKLGACVKGTEFFATKRRKDAGSLERLTTPMLRTPYGWENVSWDYAIDMVADTILSDRQEFGRDSLAFYGVGQMTLESLWVTKRLLQGHLGSNNICSNAEQCLSNNAGGHELVFGNEGPFSSYDDYLHADMMVFYGHNPAANHPTIFNRYVRRNRKALKVVIDPRTTDTVQALERDDSRNIHLPVRSGSDVLLNCGIARFLMDNGAFDERYIAESVAPESFRKYCRFLQEGPFDLANVAAAVSPKGFAVEEMERRLRRVCQAWTSSKVVTTSSVGINQTVGSSGVASILNLHLLTGNIGEPGRGHVRLAGQSNASSELAMGYSGRLLPFRMRINNPDHRAKMAELWDLPAWRISPQEGLPVASFAISERLRTLVVFGTNPARNFPNLKRWREKMMDLCIIYVDSYYNPEMLEYADIVLPCRTKSEHDGVFLNGERRLQALRRVADPPCEAWSDVRIVSNVATRIAERLREDGIEPRSSGASDVQLSAEQAEALARDGNLDLSAELLERDFTFPLDEWGEPRPGVVWHEILEASKGFYNEFVDGDGQPITWDRICEGEGAQWGGTHRYKKRAHGDTSPPGFPTVFRAQTALANLHTPPSERLVPFTRRKSGRFTLITGRGAMGPDAAVSNVAMFNSSTATGRACWPKENHVYISTHDAKRLQVSTGQRVVLSNDQGSLTCPVQLTDDVPNEHAYITFHPDQRGTHVNFLTRSDHIDPVTWQPLLKDTQVQISKAPVSDGVSADGVSAGGVSAGGAVAEPKQDVAPT